MAQGEKPMLVKRRCLKWEDKCVLGSGHKGDCVDKLNRTNRTPEPVMGSWMLGHE